MDIPKCTACGANAEKRYGKSYINPSYRQTCRSCRHNGEYGRHRDSYLDRRIKNDYGIGLAEYRVRAEKQDYKCYICGKDCRDTKICLDHNHETGEIRKFLCNKCNMIVGVVEDTELLEAVIRYLEEHN